MVAPGPHSVFVYGTLCSDEVLRMVTGAGFPRRPGVLSGYRRVLPPGGYPYVLPAHDEEVSGDVLSGIDDRALALLDRYEDEGTLYVRRREPVRCERVIVPCFVYVGNPAAHGR
jgi:gamma-glutamylcyclotransferase (GGCT)/AIG2-like uncharacterized protein YtfP